jgi:hypothetical protein
MKGADYIALKRISNRENQTLAAVGETCERVPSNALHWLLEDLAIEKVSPVNRPAPKPSQSVATPGSGTPRKVAGKKG